MRRWSVVVFTSEGEGFLVSFSAVALQRRPHHIFASFRRLDAHLGNASGFGNCSWERAQDIFLAGDGATAGRLSTRVGRCIRFHPFFLAVVTPSWLLRKTFAAGLEERTRHISTEVERHEQPVRAREADDVCFTHLRASGHLCSRWSV